MSEKKTKKKGGLPIIPVILLVVFLGVAVFSLIKIITINSEYKESEKEYNDIAKDAVIFVDDSDQQAGDSAIIPYPLFNHEYLKERNSDYVGWIQIDDTEVNYPVTYGVDNEYYVKHSFDGRWTSSGCIFTDCRNAADFSSFQTILYGHSMLDHSMFFTLQRYPRSDFFYSHQNVEIYRDNKLYIYTAFSFFKTESDSYVYFTDLNSESDNQAFANRLIRDSYYNTGISVSGSDKIITLSTCVNPTGPERWVLHCKLTDVIDLSEYYH